MKINKALISGISYISRQQLENGGFISYSSNKQNNFDNVMLYETTFFPSMILSALSVINNTKSLHIKHAITNFLIDNKSDDWSFNYWANRSLENQTKPYPNDLDDTFCALAGLMQNKPDMFDSQTLVAIAQLLIAAESTEGGPYRTWLVGSDDSQWQDVDVAVNANVAYFLSLHNVKLPSLVTLAEKAIIQDLKSPYYPSQIPIFYFIGRWYKGDQVQVLVNKLLSLQENGIWENPMNTALAVTTLLHYDYPASDLQHSIDYLLKSQKANGSWPATAFCIDPALHGDTYYAGSASLATVFCLEALHEFQVASATPLANVATHSKPVEYTAVVNEVNRVIMRLPHPDVRRHTRKILRQIINQDKDGQIIVLPWFIAKACSKRPDESLLRQLALGSLWGWMAYTTYDDFLDGEGEVVLLPGANVALRNLSYLQKNTLPGNSQFQTEVQQIMNRLDAANAWELQHCRGVISNSRMYIKHLPDYGDLWQLADRSLGHTIAGIGVLYGIGLDSSSPTIIALRTFFKHYLIARQLNDDAHDWEQDLLRGHVNVVAAKVLKDWHPKGRGQVWVIDLVQDIEYLRRLMWESTILEVCGLITEHISLARQALAAPGVQLVAKYLDTVLVPLQNSCDEALHKRDQALNFIATL